MAHYPCAIVKLCEKRIMRNRYATTIIDAS
jgi:hypothetical protein